MTSEILPPFTPLAESLPATVPFVGPEAQERARGKLFDARIGANESVFGPSPRAIEAMAAAARQTWMYGDPEAYELRAAIAAKHDVPMENIVVGEGIDGLLGYTARLFVAGGAPVATSLGAYPTFNYHVAGYGGRLVTTPYRNDREDLEALLDLARREGARLVFLANPDNPMGTWWGAAEIVGLMDALPSQTVLLLDEAYIETAPTDAAPPIELDRPNVIRFRTFSKAQGMAGLRVGYAIANARLVKAYDKIRNHFGVGRVAQAGALASVGDTEWLAHVVGEVSTSRDRIAAIASQSGLNSIPSATNFVAVDCGRDGVYAKRVLSELVARGVFVRMPGVPPLDRCIRVSCGKPPDLDLFAQALPEALAAAG